MQKAGFTIVELLIVIVVIAIIAAITLVAYNGVQDRARFSKMRQDLSSVRKALELYKADNGGYPDSRNCVNQNSNYIANWCGWNGGTNDSFIPGLAPTYIKKTPTILNPVSSRDTYLYRSADTPSGNYDGTRYYELIRYKPASDGGLSSAEKTGNIYLWGNDYDGIAWGFMSDPSMQQW